MKIGFLITYFYPKIGGAENNCYSLAKELAKKNEVHVFCSGEKDSEEIIEGINIHRSREVMRLKYYFAFYPGIADSLLRYELDILHVHGFGFIQHDIAVKRLKKNNPKIRIICTPHGPFMALNKYNLVGNVFKKSYVPIIKRSLKNYDIIIEVNPFQREWMEKDYGISPEKIKFLPNGIEKETFRKIDRKTSDKISIKYNLDKRFIITYLGRVQKYKGIDQIVNILPEISKLKKNILFVVMGDDAGDMERLKGIAEKLNVSKNLLFTGRVSEDEKLAILDKSEIFAFPSEWEAFGISMLEAMARKNAVISSRTEGGKYLITEGENGFLYNYKDLKELREKIEIIIKDDKKRKKMKENNYKKSKKYIWSDIAMDLEAIYRK